MDDVAFDHDVVLALGPEPTGFAGALLAMSWGYFALAEYTFEYFHCKTMNGVQILYAEPSIECFKFGDANKHTKLFPLAIWALIVYPIGMLVLVAFVLYRYRPNHPDLEMRRIGAYRRAIAQGDADADNLKRLLNFRIMFGCMGIWYPPIIMACCIIIACC